jgi:hypothetical protein
MVGVDIERGELTSRYDAFVLADLNAGIPDLGNDPFDYVLALDVIEHLIDPEAFLDDLRQLTAKWPDVKVIVTTGNVGFILMRLSLMLGRFEYARRGILDITHTRLFTFATLQRAMRSAGFEIETTQGVMPPLPFVFGSSRSGRALMAVARALAKMYPKLFGFQCVTVARPRPTLETLIARAQATATRKQTRAA